MSTLLLAFRFAPLVMAIVAIVWLEFMYRRFKIKLWYRLTGRLNYPVWSTMVLQQIDGLGWLMWVRLGYCCILGFVAIKLCNDILFVETVRQDFLELRREMVLMQDQAREIQERRNALAESGCLLGLHCIAMGGDGRDCDNFDHCNGMQSLTDNFEQQT